jgi:glutamate-1-semialdehyde 2,1-aminomutase
MNGDNETFKNSSMDCCRKEFILRLPLMWFITDALTYEDLDFTIRAIDKVSKLLNKKSPKFGAFFMN